MAEFVIRQNWRNSNERIKYPFSEDSTLTNSEGDKIPDNAFIDGTWHPIGNQSEDLYLSRIRVTGYNVSIYMSGEEENLCSASFNRSLPPDRLDFLDTLGRPSGAAIVSPTALSEVCSWTFGDHMFSLEDTRIAGSQIIPMPEVGVRGFATESGDILTDDVTFMGEDGVYFEVSDLLEGDGIILMDPEVTGFLDDPEDYPRNLIRVNASGDPLFLRKICEEESGDEETRINDGPFLQTINEISADDIGNFIVFPGDEVVDDSIIRIFRDGSGIRIEAVGQWS